MLDWFISVISNKWVILVYLAICYTMTYLGLRTLKPLVQKNDADKKRDEKYHAFRRNDMDRISPVLCYIFAPLVLFKFCTGWFMTAFSWAFFRMNCMFKDDDKIYSGFGLTAARWANYITGMVNMWMVGCPFCERIQIDVDYKEYLGPDSEIRWTGPGSIITTHNSFVDIFVHTRYRIPAHICKKATLAIPWIGSGAAMCGSLFVERDSKNSKTLMMSQLAEH